MSHCFQTCELSSFKSKLTYQYLFFPALPSPAAGHLVGLCQDMLLRVKLTHFNWKVFIIPAEAVVGYRNSRQESSCQSQLYLQSLHLQSGITAASTLFKGNICWVVSFIKQTAENNYLHKDHQIPVRGNCFVWVWWKAGKAVHTNAFIIIPCLSPENSVPQNPANVTLVVLCYYDHWKKGRWKLQ